LTSELAKGKHFRLIARIGQVKAIIFNAFRNADLRTFCSCWLPPLLLTGLVLVFSGELGDVKHTQWIIGLVKTWFPSMTRKEAMLVHLFFRKLGHFSIYAVLFIAWVRTLRWHLGFRPSVASLLALMIILSVALVDEGNQAFIKTRTSNPWDVLLDFSGALMATLMIFPFLSQPSQWKKKNLT